MTRSVRVTRGVVLLAAACVMTAGAAHKSLCFGDGFLERSLTLVCYSDLLPLYEAEELDSGKIPYVEAENEYPVGTGLFMWAASWPVDSREAFFASNAVLLALLGLLTAWLLYGVVQRRALYFAAAPTLALYEPRSARGAASRCCWGWLWSCGSRSTSPSLSPRRVGGASPFDSTPSDRRTGQRCGSSAVASSRCSVAAPRWSTRCRSPCS